MNLCWKKRTKRKINARKLAAEKASIIFTKEEKQICDIIVKSDFAKCNFESFNKCFFYNNLQLSYRNLSGENGYENIFYLYRRDNKHLLKTISLGLAKMKIVKQMIDDKFKAYVENSIVSAFADKKNNIDDCSYCGTKNSKNRSNCINCGAILSHEKY